MTQPIRVDYEAIDLTPFVNADDDIEVPGVEMWRGQSVLRGNRAPAPAC
jgi:hypothetical protein